MRYRIVIHLVVNNGTYDVQQFSYDELPSVGEVRSLANSASVPLMKEGYNVSWFGKILTFFKDDDGNEQVKEWYSERGFHKGHRRFANV